MSALLQSRLAPPTAHEALTTGRRYTGLEAAAAGIAAATYELDQLVDEAVSWAATQAGKAGPTRHDQAAHVRRALGLLNGTDTDA